MTSPSGVEVELNRLGPDRGSVYGIDRDHRAAAVRRVAGEQFDADAAAELSEPFRRSPAPPAPRC
jgi:hypothetical protein